MGIILITSEVKLTLVKVLGATQMFTNRQMDKKNVIETYNGIFIIQP